MRIPRRTPLPRLDSPDHLGPGFRDVVLACCRRPLAFRGAVPDERAVHRSRQALKRARAVLRLGEALDVSGTKTVRQRLARLARELSPLRDTVVAAKIANRFARKLEGRLRADAEELAATKTAGGLASWWSLWKQRLRDESQTLDRLDWGELPEKKVLQALRHSAKRICRRARHARKSDIASMHAWRKAVIVLREQVLALEPLLGKTAAAVHLWLHQLSRRLGQAMDAEVFVAAVQRSPQNLRRSRAQLCRFARKEQKHALRRARKCWPKTRQALEHELG